MTTPAEDTRVFITFDMMIQENPVFIAENGKQADEFVSALLTDEGLAGLEEENITMYYPQGDESAATVDNFYKFINRIWPDGSV